VGIGHPEDKQLHEERQDLAIILSLRRLEHEYGTYNVEVEVVLGVFSVPVEVESAEDRDKK